MQITSPEFSIFENHTAANPRTTNLAEVFQKIVGLNSPLVGQTVSIQTLYKSIGGGKKGKKAIATLKAALQVVAFGATGDRKVVSKPSGLICVDIDGTGEKTHEILANLRSCPYIVLPFISPSGDGIKAVLRIPIIDAGDQSEIRNKFKIAYKAIAAYLLETYGVNVDMACSDILRLCYLPHDPGASLNEQAVEFPVDFTADASAASESSSPIEGRRKSKAIPLYVVRALLFSIAPKPVYEDWLKVSASVSNSLVDNDLAISLLKAWSPEEVEGEYARLLASPFNEIGIGTLRHYAAQNDFFYVYEQFVYDESTGHYLFRCDTAWVRLRGEGTTKDHLLQFLGKLPEDCPLCQIRTEQNVAYAGEIAGYPAGIKHFNNRKVLILNGPKIVSAKEGNYSVLRNFFETLFPCEDQQFAFYAWLQHCRRALLSQRRLQSPALALVGERGAGKSLAIRVINLSLGGRSAAAHRFLSGETNFNADVIGAELLVIDDEAARRELSKRLKLAQNLKSHFYAENVRLESKGVNALTVAPIQALVMAVNSDPQHLRVLPEIDETMRDKIILLQTARGELPADLRGSSRLEEVLTQEIPGFLHYLESQDYSSHYDSGRLRCYWDSRVVDALCLLSPEMQLHALIVATPALCGTFRPGAVVPEFTAAEIQAALMENAGTRHPASTLLTYPNSCGIYLAKLADIPGTGISRGRMDSRTRVNKWAIDLQIEEDASS